MYSEHDIRRAIMGECIRMTQILQEFGAALEQPPPPQIALPFYSACVEYLRASLERLHMQDQRIIDLLTPLVPADAAEDQKILGQFQTGLDASQKAVGDLLAALETYRQSEGSHQQAFENQARAFLDVFINILGARRHTSSHLEETHFTRDDWADVAMLSDAASEYERQCFDAVKQSAPPGADPDSFRAGPRPANPND